MAVIEETLEKGGSLKATRRKLAIGRDRMYALRDEQGDIMHSMEEIIKTAERLHTSDGGAGGTTESTSFNCDVPSVTKKNVEKAFKGMKR